MAHRERNLALATEFLLRSVAVHVRLLSQEQDPAYRPVVSMGEVYKMEHVAVEMGLREIVAKRKYVMALRQQLTVNLVPGQSGAIVRQIVV